MLESIFNNVAGPQACDFLRRDSKCFSVNITKFLRTPILKTSANGCFCVTLLFYIPSFSNS